MTAITTFVIAHKEVLMNALQLIAVLALNETVNRNPNMKANSLVQALEFYLKPRAAQAVAAFSGLLKKKIENEQPEETEVQKPEQK